jgi:hypothetical protein
MSKEEKKPRKLSTLEKAASYPARVALFGGLAAGEAGDQFLYNRGVRSPKFSEDTKQGKGYEKAKKLGRIAVGIDPIDEDEKKMKKGGKVKSSASKRADGIAQRGKTKGRII